jgi:hypothetical protein
MLARAQTHMRTTATWSSPAASPSECVQFTARAVLLFSEGFPVLKKLFSWAAARVWKTKELQPTRQEATKSIHLATKTQRQTTLFI